MLDNCMQKIKTAIMWTIDYPQIRKCRTDTLEKTFFALLFISQGKPNYKVFNIEYFIEQFLVEKNYII